MPLLCTQHLIQNSLCVSPSIKGRYNLPTSEEEHTEVSSSKGPGWAILIKAPETGRKLAQWDQIEAPLKTWGYL